MLPAYFGAEGGGGEVKKGGGAGGGVWGGEGGKKKKKKRGGGGWALEVSLRICRERLGHQGSITAKAF